MDSLDLLSKHMKPMDAQVKPFVRSFEDIMNEHRRKQYALEHEELRHVYMRTKAIRTFTGWLEYLNNKPK